MNYQKIYNNFIKSRKEKTTISDYHEKHHIIPKCYGGSNKEINIITLTAYEHLFAHRLLAKIHGGKMLFALSMMCFSNGRQTRNTNRNVYNSIKKELSEYMSKTRRGKPTNQVYTTEVRDKISKIALEKWKDADFIKKIKESRAITHNNKNFKENQRAKALNAIDKMTPDEFKEKYIESRPLRKQIVVIEPNGKTNEFLSIREASRHYNIERKTIQTSIRENRVLSKGNFLGYSFLEKVC